MASIDLRHLDKRTAERYIRDGVITREAYDKHLADLPDLEAEAESITEQVYAADADDEPQADA